MMCHFSSLFISKYDGSFSEEYLHQTQNSSQHSNNFHQIAHIHCKRKEKNAGDEQRGFFVFSMINEKMTSKP